MQSLPRKRTQKTPGDGLAFASAEMTLSGQPFDGNAPAWLETRHHGRISHYPIYGGEFLVGRGSHCDLVLESAKRFVSREHASITALEGQYSITDLSINGTWLNGARLTRRRQALLRSSDTITIEDWELTFHVNSDVAAQPA
jgi:predicted component of type VI protein secretion system